MSSYIKQTGDNNAIFSLSTENLVVIFKKMVETNNATVSQKYPELAEILNPLFDEGKWAEAFEEYKKFLLEHQDYPLVKGKDEVVGELEFAAALTEWGYEKFAIIYDPLTDYRGDCFFSIEPTFVYDWIATRINDNETPFSQKWAENAKERLAEGDGEVVYTDEVWEFDGGRHITDNLDYLLIKQGFVNLQRAFTITTTANHKTAKAKIKNFGDWVLE